MIKGELIITLSEEQHKRLLEDIRSIIKEELSDKVDNENWLRTRDVKDFLGCSDGHLVNLRVTGKLQYSKINGTIYYKKSDILNMLNSGIKN